LNVDWTSIRREFPALANYAYLNTASYGQVPREGANAMLRHLAHRDELACTDFLSWFDDMDRLRVKVARLIACEAADIAFIPNAATGLAILLNGLDWRAGDRVLTLEHEFPNNLYAPALLARHGVDFVACPWDRFYDSMDERTRLVLVSSVNYNTGFAPPLEELSRFLRARGAILFVDGTQSIGALRFDAGRIQPDMLAVNAYKWMNAPNGAGFAYVSPKLRESLPPNTIGWRSHRDWRNVDNLHHGAPELTLSAERYEGGMLGFPSLYAMEASIDMLLAIGPEVIEKRALELAGAARDLLAAAGGDPNRYDTPIVTARFPGRDVSRLAEDLKQRRVIVSARRGQLRVSTHFYNNEDDLTALERELRALS
jgi:cysteine desulfurase/selenocysteine lyase